MEYLAVAAYALLLAGLVLLLMSSSSRSRREQRIAAARLAAIETKLDAVIAHLGVEIRRPTHPDVEELVRQGKKIQAIKLYREQTGADLLTAKLAVEAYEGAVKRA